MSVFVLSTEVQLPELIEIDRVRLDNGAVYSASQARPHDREKPTARPPQID
jgi:hypothetical protein